MATGRAAATAILIAACLVAMVSHARAATLDDVRARGSLACGVNPDLAGFSEQADDGRWSGFDIDYCRAIAAAVLGDGEAVTFVPLSARERFDALKDGTVDVLVRDTAWTMARDTQYGLTFVAVNFFNGVGFLVPASLGINSALQLAGSSVCAESGSLAEVSVQSFFARQAMAYVAVPVAGDEDAERAYGSGQCDALAGDRIDLYALRARLDEPSAQIVLPESLSKDAYGLVVRQGDDQWFAIVRWVHFALLNAEELAITSATAGDPSDSPDEDVRYLLGLEGNFGAGLGLEKSWAAGTIRAVGNYGEMFERNLGTESPLGMARGLNRLWSDGGLHFAPPVR